jgi:uncharacterized protein YndB with AHSA1/START domain
MEITNTRVFDFPRALVWQAYRDPQQLARWWGPKGFTNTIHEFDLRAGGKWVMTMHGPDGVDYKNTKDFVEVLPMESLVFHHLQPMHFFTMTITLADAPGCGTRMSWLMVFESDEHANLKDFLTQANEANFDRLEERLKHMA